MIDWDEETEDIRAFLMPRCGTAHAYDFWYTLFDDLTDMFDGQMSNDPVLWLHYVEADNSMDQKQGFIDRDRFMTEAWERGYDLYAYDCDVAWPSE